MKLLSLIKCGGCPHLPAPAPAPATTQSGSTSAGTTLAGENTPRYLMYLRILPLDCNQNSYVHCILYMYIFSLFPLQIFRKVT